jgi:hypothetical protein
MFKGWKIANASDERVVEAVKRANGKFADHVLGDIRHGVASAYITPRGVLVVRPDWPELVAVTFCGKDGRSGLDELKQIAHAKGFETVRIHAETLAIGRLYNIGEPCEYVWRVDVKENQNG